MYAACIDLEKAHNKIDRKAVWIVLQIYDVGGQLMDGIKTLYREVNACAKVNGVIVLQLEWKQNRDV